MKSPEFAAAGFVLVGGQSSRMGCDKALLEFNGTPMLLRMTKLLQPFVGEIRLLGPTSSYSKFGIPILPDAYPNLGPLGAIFTGLEHTSYDWNLFLACDLPFLTPHIIELLLDRASRTAAQAVVPVAGNRYQPLSAAYHRSCSPVVGEMIANKDRLSLVDLLSTLRVDTLVPAPEENDSDWDRVFWNANTRRQWEQMLTSVATQE
jgi:molybdopterin-guanine dinucleotide biosynthesis protein A